MKNFTNNFKQFTSRLSARWLIMALMMLVGTSSAWAANITGGTKLYFKSNSTWDADGARYAAYFCNGTSAAMWYSMTKSGDYWTCTVSSGESHKNVIFCRMNPNTTSNNWNDAFWSGQTKDLTWDGSNNLATIKNDGNMWDKNEDVSWSCYDDVTAYTVSGTGTTVKLSDSDTWITYTLYKDGTTVSNSGKKGTGSALSWTVTESGTYTVKGTNGCRTDNMSGSYTYPSCTTVSATQYPISPVTFTYNGNKQVPTITPATGAGDVTSTVYKLNNTTTVENPTDAGTYDIYVTTNAGTVYCAITTATKIGTFTIDKKTVAKEQYTISPTTFTYNGSKQVPTITPATGAGAVTSTVYKLNNTTTVENPTDAGTYTVYVTSNAGTNYTAASSLNIGTFTINKKTVAKEQYSMSPTTFSYNGSKQVPTITPAAGAGTVTSTVYKLNNTTTVANPTDAGTYTVYVTSSVGTNYTAASNLNIGTFTINEVCDPITNLTWSITPESKTTYCPGDKVTVTMTYNGSTAKGYKWGGDYNGNIGLSGGSIASGAVYTMTINKSGSVNLTLTGCDGKTATTSTLTFNVVQAPETPTVSVIQNIIKCGNEITQSGKIRITNYNSNYSYKIGANNDPLPASSIDAQGYISGLTIADKFTLYAINSCGTETPSAPFTITETNNTPTISGKTSTQPGKSNAIELTVPSGITASWSVSPNADLSVFSGNSTMFSSENEGTYTITATYNGCSDTHVVTVSRGYTVYLRRPHASNETKQYNYWFEKTATAGPGYVKFGTVKTNPTTTEMYGYNGGTSSTTKDPNEIATRGTEAFIDCEGYVWDAYNIGLDVTALYFRAPNDKATNNTYYGGQATYTLSYTQNSPIAEDMYFTMGDWSSSNQYGRALNKVNKPFDGVTIDALGSTEICSNNMASFAALYLESNCTGQEITAYAWKFSTNNSSWNDYNTGKGANTNNIRPNKAGYYRLECTLKDGTVVTSNSIQITTKTCAISNSSLNNITSNLPIIMVNTGEKSFPECENTTDFPTKHADKLKKKRSVDVKILWNPNGTVSSSDAYSNGETLYYDRKARMNYRGSSSLNFEKKSYAFCPGDENCGQDKDESPDYVKTKKMKMFGIGSAEDKDWVLYAAYVDPTMMRNMLAMETYSAMTGKWGVKGKYVELYVDGEYQGVYIFMDKITQNENRVNIKWEIDKSDDSKSKRQFILKFDKTDPADRIGGYNGEVGDEKTFKTDRTGKKDIGTYGTKIDQMFEIEYPEKEDIEEDYGVGAWAEVNSFIQRKVDELEDAIYSQNYTKVRELLDYTSWADFFILNEYTKNEDAYRASCVFVFNGEKFEVWPLWDYELSFNNRVTKQGKNNGSTTGLLIKTQAVYNDAFPAPFWWTGKDDKGTAGLLADDCFLQMIASRWATHTSASGALNPTNIQKLVDSYNTILTKNNAHTRDAAKWPYSSRGISACNRDKTGYYSSGDGGSIDSFNASLTDLENWIGTSGRIGSSSYGLTKAIDDLTGELEFTITATADKDVTTPWRPVNITVNAVGAGYTYSISPATIGGQVVVGNDNFLIYPEATGEYTVTTTLDAASQCGNSGENPTHTLKFKVEKLDDICPAPGN